LTASEDQAEAERAIFIEFAATVPRAVNSIECDVEGEGPVAFEVSQVTNESLERAMRGTIKRAKSFAPHTEHSRLNRVSESWTVLVACLPFSLVSRAVHRLDSGGAPLSRSSIFSSSALTTAVMNVYAPGMFRSGRFKGCLRF
jgi:hypothetical protein